MNWTQLSPRERVLASLVGGVVALLLVLVAVRFFVQTQAQLRADLAQRRVELAALDTLRADRATWEARDAWLRASQPPLENEGTAGVQLLQAIQTLGKKHAVLIEQPAIGTPERRPHCTSVPVNVETKSTWPALIAFLHELQGPDRFIVLETANLRIDPADQTQMRGRFRIAKWFAPPAG